MKATIAVIGAGTMGEGIAQLALQADHPVILVDPSAAQRERAKASLDKRFAGFVAKGKWQPAQHEQRMALLTLAENASAAAPAHLVIEAIIENLDIKKALFAELESVVAKDAILASNTSSLSITAMAAELEHPERFLGLHFFNPPGLMPLVEVIRALQSADSVVDEATALMRNWGKSPVLCKDTPGFIVNRVARPFYVESFRLLEEQALAPAALDAALRGAGFKMGPCELTDLIGQDVNYAVSTSLWTALGYPPHLQPSWVQGDLVAARYLGRKSGRGFYPEGTGQAPPENHAPTIAYQSRDGLCGTLANGVAVKLSDGRRAFDHERESGTPTILLDHHAADATHIALAMSPGAKALMGDALPEAEVQWLPMPDRPGLVALRVISQIIHEAATCALAGIARPADIDIALKGGVNYPHGAFAFLERIGLATVLQTIRSLNAYYGARYAPSPWLLDLEEEKNG
ncbi:MAG: 3-hydroxyacyl-CoA dehydrogenase NAD-binding domain-containing protein [Cardiobacteriaceae bacterium]|nr:3-hydroxyacyl-CoA dehydrogenase NAD-binding domain-containing protein [Cardiobacteriaceae bacterium]